MSETPETNPTPETPVVETAPVVAVPEGEKGAEGTAASPDPSATPPTPTPETPADDKSAEFFQSKYQEATAQLNAMGGGQEQPPQPQPQQQPATVTHIPQQQPSPNQEELNQMLQDNPLMGLSAVTNQLGTMMDQKFAQLQAFNERQVQEQNAQRVVNDLVSKSGVSQEIADSAKQYVQSITAGSNLPPQAIAQLTIDAIQRQQMLSGTQLATTQAVADATQAAKTQVLTTQPTGGVPPEGKPLTKEQMVANKFAPSAGKQTLESLKAGRVD